MTITVFVAVQADRQILLQISENDRPLAHALLDRKGALKIAEQLRGCALLLDEYKAAREAERINGDVSRQSRN